MSRDSAAHGLIRMADRSEGMRPSGTRQRRDSFLTKNTPAALPRSQHDAFERAAIERRVLGFSRQLAGFHLPDTIRIEQA